jgi:isopentenyl diphosphate isomerase/L-lactate dehydrogenase-like FMN-dependent dehydrogenase
VAYLWALAVDGEDGVVRLLDQLRAEISTAMRLLGAASLSALGPGLLGPAP